MKQKGFTIVELLIVIVVIAILAAIVIVAYQGVQQRARAAQAQVGITHYVKALNLYNIDNQAYPIPAANNNLACFGGVNGCHPSENVAATAALDAGLKPYMKSYPTLPAPYAANFLITWVAGTGFYIYFVQEGTGNCMTISGTTFLSSSPSGANLVCRYTLPNPG